MKESFYIKNRTVVINFSAAYYQTVEELLASEEFKEFLKVYLSQLSVSNSELYDQIVRNETVETRVPQIIMVLKMLMVLEMDSVSLAAFLHHFDPAILLVLVEDAYNYWRKLERFTTVNTNSSTSLQYATFMEADQKLNTLIISLYRTLEEKLQGHKNSVYRQMSAGSNGSMVLCPCDWNMPEEYACLKDIPFIHTLTIRTPLLLYPRSNKREGMFKQVSINPITSFESNNDKNYWMCFPMKVGSLLTFVYFHQDFLSSGISLANLFELATEEDCLAKKPDAIVLFGNEDGLNDTQFYHDDKNGIWVGNVSYHQRIEYFGYMKKMALTLHNVAKMANGWLPIHGAMVNIYLKNGRRKGVVMIGDSGAGKSETIEALKGLGNKDIQRVDVVFDDMGSFHIENGRVFAQGTETGAFVRLDDLDSGTAYRDMERSIFMNPESSNARVILPASSYQLITQNHVVDMVLYANNYEDKRGMHEFVDKAEAKDVFIQGKRMALGTTQEKGLSSTYFANPFGPMQQQEICDGIFDSVFDQLYTNGIFVGEIYTNLGLTGDKSGLQVGASELLEFIKNN